MTIDHGAVQRPEQSGADITCSGSNKSHDDEHREELQRPFHRDSPKRVEGSVGASAAKTSSPRGLCTGRSSEFARTGPRFPPTRSVMVKKARAHWGLGGEEPNLSSQSLRPAAPPLRIWAE